MRRVILFIVSALALVLAAPATSATVTVSIKRAGFAPKTVNINQDDSVTWTNHDTINHQVVANNGSYASPILGPGKSWTRKFASGGTFRYHDSLHPSLTGTVVVKGAPPQISLVASAPVVKYGAPVMLSGVVSNKKSGETVTLVQLPFGQTTKQVIATLQTTAGGAYSYSVTPQVNTTYQAQWPGKSVFLQRYTLARTWVNIRTLTLGPKSGRLISVRFVRSLIPRGRWSIRVFMPATEMGGGYLDGWSGTQPVVRR